MKHPLTHPFITSKVKFPLTERADDPLDLYQHLPFQIAVVTNLLQLNKDAAIRKITDLEPREFRVLLNVGSFMPIKAADIAYLGRLDSYTVSRAVKSLAKEKLINFELSEHNRKVKKLVLTDKGLEIYYRLCKAIKIRTLELESVLSLNEKNELMRLLLLVESKAEAMMADHAKQEHSAGRVISADQKEIIRWHKKSCTVPKYTPIKSR